MQKINNRKTSALKARMRMQIRMSKKRGPHPRIRMRISDQSLIHTIKFNITKYCVHFYAKYTYKIKNLHDNYNLTL